MENQRIASSHALNQTQKDNKTPSKNSKKQPNYYDQERLMEEEKKINQSQNTTRDNPKEESKNKKHQSQRDQSSKSNRNQGEQDNNHKKSGSTSSIKTQNPQKKERSVDEWFKLLTQRLEKAKKTKNGTLNLPLRPNLDYSFQNAFPQQQSVIKSEESGQTSRQKPVQSQSNSKQNTKSKSNGDKYKCRDKIEMTSDSQMIDNQQMQEQEVIHYQFQTNNDNTIPEQSDENQFTTFEDFYNTAHVQDHIEKSDDQQIAQNIQIQEEEKSVFDFGEEWVYSNSVSPIQSKNDNINNNSIAAKTQSYIQQQSPQQSPIVAKIKSITQLSPLQNKTLERVRKHSQNSRSSSKSNSKNKRINPFAVNTRELSNILELSDEQYQESTQIINQRQNLLEQITPSSSKYNNNFPTSDQILQTQANSSADKQQQQSLKKRIYSDLQYVDDEEKKDYSTGQITNDQNKNENNSKTNKKLKLNDEITKQSQDNSTTKRDDDMIDIQIPREVYRTNNNNLEELKGVVNDDCQTDDQSYVNDRDQYLDKRETENDQDKDGDQENKYGNEGDDQVVQQQVQIINTNKNNQNQKQQEADEFDTLSDDEIDADDYDPNLINDDEQTHQECDYDPNNSINDDNEQDEFFEGHEIKFDYENQNYVINSYGDDGIQAQLIMSKDEYEGLFSALNGNDNDQNDEQSDIIQKGRRDQQMDDQFYECNTETQEQQQTETLEVQAQDSKAQQQPPPQNPQQYQRIRSLSQPHHNQGQNLQSSRNINAQRPHQNNINGRHQLTQYTQIRTIKYITDTSIPKGTFGRINTKHHIQLNNILKRSKINLQGSIPEASRESSIVSNISNQHSRGNSRQSLTRGSKSRNLSPLSFDEKQEELENNSDEEVKLQQHQYKKDDQCNKQKALTLNYTIEYPFNSQLGDLSKFTSKSPKLSDELKSSKIPTTHESDTEHSGTTATSN
eukprot:403347734